MQGAGRETCHQAIFPAQYGIEGGIVGEHREHNLPIGRRGSGTVCQYGARFDERPGFLEAAIPNGDIVAGAQQIAGNRGTHLAKTNEAYFHDDIL
jgi:hypothetical protein